MAPRLKECLNKANLAKELATASLLKLDKNGCMNSDLPPEHVTVIG